MSHRILLVNFTARDTKLVADAGYNVERGYIGRLLPSAQHEPHLPYFFPHPVYDVIRPILATRRSLLASTRICRN